MKENIKKSLMIMLKGYKENVVREDDVLTLIDAIMDNYATNTITSPLYNSNINGLNRPLKYKLTDEFIDIGDKKLYRIEALKDFASIKKGDKGGFVESEENLSQNDNCWVYRNARVKGDAKVFGDAQVYGNAKVNGNAEISGNAKISSISDYIIFKNWWSSGRHFTWTRSNNMWKVGCFYGTGEELIEKAYKDSELSGKEYEKVVKYAETILKDTYDKCYRYIL